MKKGTGFTVVMVLQSVSSHRFARRSRSSSSRPIISECTHPMLSAGRLVLVT